MVYQRIKVCNCIKSDSTVFNRLSYFKEYVLSVQECNENQFTCHNEEQCIPLEYLCDGHVDCSDKSDESKDAKCCDARTEFTCDNGECIDRKRVCDGNENCFDKSDENDNRECDIRPPCK